MLILLLTGCSGLGVGLVAGLLIAQRRQRSRDANRAAMAHSEQLATLGRVAAALAHELRNPLTSMRIIVQAASDEESGVGLDAKELSILENEIERLDDSIQTFLDYARPPQPDRRRYILQSLLDETLAAVQRRAQQVNVDLRNELPIDPIAVSVDAAQIKQVFFNIILNALEASPDGGVITLRAIAAAPASDDLDSPGEHEHQVKVEISDTGRGLPLNLGDRIFDAFVSTKDTGTGLGLAICKRIVESHQGSLSARNADPRGSVLTVSLPRAL